MMHSSSRQAESSPISHQAVHFDVTRPLKSQARKYFARFFCCGNVEWLLDHHSIRQDGKLHLVSSNGCSVCFEILFTSNAGIAQLVQWLTDLGLSDCRVSAGTREFPLVQSVQNVLVPGTENSARVHSEGGVKFTTHLHPVPTLKIRGVTVTLPRIFSWHGAWTHGQIYYGGNSASSVHNRSECHAVACRMFGLFLVPSAFPVQLQC